MAIGNQPSMTTLNGIAGNLTVTLRNTMVGIQQYNSYIQFLGTGGLTALGFSTADATSMLAIFANLDAIITACTGGDYTGPPLPYDFLAEAVPLWGGQ